MENTQTITNKIPESEQGESFYEQYVQLLEKDTLEEKELFYVFLDVPEFWEVGKDGKDGAIFNENEKKASVYYKVLKEISIVDQVEWYDAAGQTIRIDYYNKYGYNFSSLFFSAERKPVCKAFYTSKHEEIININYSNGVVILFEKGTVKQIFHSEEEFKTYASNRLKR